MIIGDGGDDLLVVISGGIAVRELAGAYQPVTTVVLVVRAHAAGVGDTGEVTCLIPCLADGAVDGAGGFGIEDWRQGGLDPAIEFVVGVIGGDLQIGSRVIVILPARFLEALITVEVVGSAYDFFIGFRAGGAVGVGDDGDLAVEEKFGVAPLFHSFNLLLGVPYVGLCHGSSTSNRISRRCLSCNESRESTSDRVSRRLALCDVSGQTRKLCR